VKVPTCGRAAGKVILLGEHAVVYGRPGLAAGIGRFLTAEVSAEAGAARLETDRAELAADGRPARLLTEAARMLGLPDDGLVIRVRSELPAGVGLGSSAALAVAVLRALAAAAERTLTAAEELAMGTRLEAIFHGHPSGIDPAAAALGTCLRFVRGEPPAITAVRPSAPLRLTIAFHERPRRTSSLVTALRQRWEADRARHERLFDEIGALVDAGARAVADGDIRTLGSAFDRNQALLSELGVSSPEVEALVGSARRAGAFGAKLTGGGGGGAIIAVGGEPERLAAALAATGACTIVTEVGA